MCMLTFYRPGVKVNASRLRNGAISNRDGHGFAVVVEGKVPRLEVGHSMNSEAAISAFVRVREKHPESYAIFHSRFTTDGLTNLENCHPFHVGGDSRTVLAHNGILPKEARPVKGEDRSDTRILAESILPRFPFGHLRGKRARKRFTRWMLSEDYPNKVAILTVDPAYPRRAYLFNQSAGLWLDGVWYSNSGCRTAAERFGTSAGYRWTYGSSFDYRPVTTIGGTHRKESEGSVLWETSAGYRSIGGTHRKEPVSVSEPEESALWDQYMTGEISYTQYYNLSRGIEPTAPPSGNYGSCRLCGGLNTVSLSVGYCISCLMCVDCENKTSKCECWVPSSERARWADLVNEDQDDDSTAGAQAAIDGVIAEVDARTAAMSRVIGELSAHPALPTGEGS